MGIQHDHRHGDRIQSGLDRIMRAHEVPGLAVGIVEAGRVTGAFGLGVMKIGENKRSRTLTGNTVSSRVRTLS